MHIIKKCWEWNEDFNTSEIKLGMDINMLLDKGLVIPDKELPSFENKYIGTEKLTEKFGENLFSIDTFENKISFIWYRHELPFFQPDLWEKEYKYFVEEIGKIFPETTLDTEKDILYVVFSDSFVRLIAIIRGELRKRFQASN